MNTQKSNKSKLFACGHEWVVQLKHHSWVKRDTGAIHSRAARQLKPANTRARPVLELAGRQPTCTMHLRASFSPLPAIYSTLHTAPFIDSGWGRRWISFVRILPDYIVGPPNLRVLLTVNHVATETGRSHNRSRWLGTTPTPGHVQACRQRSLSTRQNTPVTTRERCDVCSNRPNACDPARNVLPIWWSHRRRSI